jgi:hypothetical protein
MDIASTLFALERELGGGDGSTYDRLLADDAVVVVPGATMTKGETVAAMDASPGWDEFAFADERCLQLGDDTALLSYRFSGRRGEDLRYAALMGSVYVRRPEGWRLAYHQQTPLQ